MYLFLLDNSTYLFRSVSMLYYDILVRLSNNTLLIFVCAVIRCAVCFLFTSSECVNVVDT